MKVTFLDLKAQYAALRHEVDPAIAKVIENCAFVGSRQLVPFETAFAQFCEIPHAIGVSNGTDALKLALLACGVRPGDEVVTVPNTFIGTTEAVTMIGAEVRFADVDERTMTLDPAAFEAFCQQHFVSDEQDQTRLLDRFEILLTTVHGHLTEIARDLRRGIQYHPL